MRTPGVHVTDAGIIAMLIAVCWEYRKNKTKRWAR